jgi:hypothetical protein
MGSMAVRMAETVALRSAELSGECAAKSSSQTHSTRSGNVWQLPLKTATSTC